MRHDAPGCRALLLSVQVAERHDHTRRRRRARAAARAAPPLSSAAPPSAPRRRAATRAAAGARRRAAHEEARDTGRLPHGLPERAPGVVAVHCDDPLGGVGVGRVVGRVACGVRGVRGVDGLEARGAVEDHAAAADELGKALVERADDDHFIARREGHGSERVVLANQNPNRRETDQPSGER